MHPHRLLRCACINGEYPVTLSASAGSGVGGACSSCRQDKSASCSAPRARSFLSILARRSPASITSGSVETFMGAGAEAFTGAAAGTTSAAGAAACSRCKRNSCSRQRVPSRRTAVSTADRGWCSQLCFGRLVGLLNQSCHFSLSQDPTAAKAIPKLQNTPSCKWPPQTRQPAPGSPAYLGNRPATRPTGGSQNLLKDCQRRSAMIQRLPGRLEWRRPLKQHGTRTIFKARRESELATPPEPARGLPSRLPTRPRPFARKS